ncbi:hypothetical protein AGLY_009789 [Aphis glycines]|uniref:Uncharacterized protein n=1 Tax=Aphis glycines TaxID=307491 RepID=A0A6G0TJ29_APHGL|nr:hypothetical protein AGLY_009789 [Aphis glycines]
MRKKFFPMLLKADSNVSLSSGDQSSGRGAKFDRSLRAFSMSLYIYVLKYYQLETKLIVLFCLVVHVCFLSSTSDISAFADGAGRLPFFKSSKLSLAILSLKNIIAYYSKWVQNWLFELYNRQNMSKTEHREYVFRNPNAFRIGFVVVVFWYRDRRKIARFKNTEIPVRYSKTW